MFLVLGTLLYTFAANEHIQVTKGDQLFPVIATGNYLPVIVGILFIVGLISSAYSAAGSALTALTTSFTVDILGTKGKEEKEIVKMRKRVHIGMAAVMGIVIFVFNILNNTSVIDAVYILASYTYGPILGLFTFGILMKQPVRDKYIPLVAIASPILCFILQKNSVACYDLKNGKKIWSFKAGKRIVGTPAATGGVIVFGSADRCIYGLNVSDGKVKWTVEAKEPVLGAVSIDNGIAYIGASDSTFRAIDIQNGNIKWAYSGIKGYIETKPLITADKVIFGAWDNTLYALNKANGKEMWKWTGGLNRMHFSPAAVWPVSADGKVFITDPERAMTAIDINSGQTVWRTYRSTVRETIGLSEDGERLYSKTMNDSIVCYSTKGNVPHAEQQCTSHQHTNPNPANDSEQAGSLDNVEMIKWYERDTHTRFDVCADDHCQRYQGITRASTEIVKQAIAATWIEASKLAKNLNALNVPGVEFRPIYLKPFYSVGKDQELQGVQVHIMDYRKAPLSDIQFLVMQEVANLYPDRAVFDHVQRQWNRS